MLCLTLRELEVRTEQSENRYPEAREAAARLAVRQERGELQKQVEAAGRQPHLLSWTLGRRRGTAKGGVHWGNSELTHFVTLQYTEKISIHYN